MDCLCFMAEVGKQGSVGIAMVRFCSLDMSSASLFMVSNIAFCGSKDAAMRRSSDSEFLTSCVVTFMRCSITVARRSSKLIVGEAV